MGMRTVDIAIGIFFVAFAGVVLTQSVQLEYYDRGIPGPGFFPILLACALALTGLLLVVSRLRGADADFGVFEGPSRSELRRALTVWLAIAIATAVMNLVGFLLTTGVLVAVLLLGVERLRTWTAVLTVILIPVVFYTVFAVLLKVRLPVGPWGI